VLLVLVIFLILGSFVFLNILSDTNNITGEVIDNTEKEVPGTNQTDDDEDIKIEEPKNLVKILEFGFEPDFITIDRGESVTWTNTHKVRKQVIVSKDLPKMKSKSIFPGGNYTFTFEESGRISYFSAVSEFGGVVIVE
jgi:plastocyanin